MKFSKILSVEIGISNIKILIPRFRKNTVYVNYFELIEFPSDKKLTFEEKVEFLTNSLEKIKKEKIYRGKKIILSILGEGIFSKNIIIPFVPEPEEKETLIWSLKNEGIEPEQYYYNLKFIRDKVDKSIKQREFLVTGILKSDVTILLNLLKTFSLKPLFIVPKLYSLFLHIKEEFKITDIELIQLIEFQQMNTVVEMVTSNGVLFNRIIPVGTNNVSKLVPDEFEAKLKDKIVDEDFLRKEDEFSREAMTLLNFLDRYVDNLTRSFDFFSTKEQNRRLDKIVLIGLSNKMHLIRQRLTKKYFGTKVLEYNKEVKKKVELSKSFAKKTELKNVDNMIGSMIGLYSKNVEDGNLLPSFMYIFKATSSIMMSAYFLVLCLVLSVALFYNLTKYITVKKENLLKEQKSLTEQIKIKNEELKKNKKFFAEKRKKMNKLDSKIKSLNKTKSQWIAKQENIKQFVTEKTNFSEVISILEQEVEKGIWFEKININLLQIDINGCGTTKESIFKFTQNLELNNRIQNVKLFDVRGVSTEDLSYNKFKLNFIIKNE